MTDFDALHVTPLTLPVPKSKWVVFIDRDGVLWEEQPVGVDFDKYLFFPGVEEAIKKLNDLGIFTVLVNNQARVARGEMSLETAKESNSNIESRFEKSGCRIDLYLFCPHSKFADVQEFKIDCNWRKPGVGMLKFVKDKLGIDLKSSYLIGDQARDFLAAKKVGVKSIGVKTGKAGSDEVFQAEPDLWADNFAEAVNLILNKSSLSR